MRQTSRFIPGEDINSLAQWQFSGVNSAFEVTKPQCPPAEEAQSSELQRQEGYAQGFMEGRAQAMGEAQQRMDDFMREQGQATLGHLATLVNSAQSQLDAGAQEMAEGVLVLACALSRQVLRHELSIHPPGLLPVIREALGQFIEAERLTHIKLNPEDLTVLEVSLRDAFKPLPLALEADPLITRGGCVLESAGRVVNGQIEKRWARVVGQLGLQLHWELNDAAE